MMKAPKLITEQKTSPENQGKPNMETNTRELQLPSVLVPNVRTPPAATQSPPALLNACPSTFSLSNPKPRPGLIPTPWGV